MKKMVKKLRSNKGFTLVEIMIVILIIAVMAAVLIPALGGAIHKARVSSAIQNASRAMEAAQVLATEHFVKGDGITEISKSDIESFLGKNDFFANADIDVSFNREAGIDAEGGAINSFTFTDTRYHIEISLDLSDGTLKETSDPSFGGGGGGGGGGDE